MATWAQKTNEEYCERSGVDMGDAPVTVADLKGGLKAVIDALPQDEV